MKKKILGLIGAMAIIALMVFNTQFTNNAHSGSITLSSLVMQAHADSESTSPDPNCVVCGGLGVDGHACQYCYSSTGGIHIGDGFCTCKNGVCQDGNWIGFRPMCGYGDSDAECLNGNSCN